MRPLTSFLGRVHSVVSKLNPDDVIEGTESISFEALSGNASISRLSEHNYHS